MTCFPAHVCPSEEMLMQLGVALRFGMATHSAASISSLVILSSAPSWQPVFRFAGHACRLEAHDRKSCNCLALNSGSRAASRISRRISSLAEAIFVGTGELSTTLPAGCGFRERLLAVGSAGRGLRERPLEPCDDIYHCLFFWRDVRDVPAINVVEPKKRETQTKRQSRSSSCMLHDCEARSAQDRWRLTAREAGGELYVKGEATSRQAPRARRR